MRGFCDLHCHLLPGVDDGARTSAESLEMARALVSLGFDTVAPSPHARPEYASVEMIDARRAELTEALDAAKIPLRLAPNAENLLDADFMATLGTPRARLLGAGSVVLVELPYAAPVPALLELLFRIRVKGLTPLIAHPERCLEFERKGRAAEAVRAGALLQLDVGALIGRYGSTAGRLATSFLEQELYAVGATDLHGAAGALEWVGKALRELQVKVGEAHLQRLLSENPHRLLEGHPLEG